MSFPIKITLLLLAALANHKGAQPPNPPPTESDKVNKSSLFEVNPRIFGFIMRPITLSLLLVEVALIVLLPLKESNATINGVVTTVCPPNPTTDKLATLSTPFITGVTMAYIGVLIRIWCYKALGTLFTYEITIRPNHKLVTWGPYAYVRHPSYVGSLLLKAGTAMAVLGTNSYVDTCGIMGNATFMSWIVRSWSVASFYVTWSLLRRAPTEDAELRNAFGEDWVNYARRVPYRFIPGIY